MFARRLSPIPWLLISIVSFVSASHAAEPKPAQAGGAKPYEKLRIDRDPSATSLLELYAGQEGESPLAVLRKTYEPPHPGGNNRLPILAREICRQALLIAARDALGWTTRDEAIGEIFEAATDAKPRRLSLVMRFPAEGSSDFKLTRLAAGEDAKTGAIVWSERLELQDKLESPLDYRLLAKAADKWSREVFPALLKDDGLPGSANKITQAAAADDVRDALESMTYAEQFAALRRLHQAVRTDGESAELLGALVRGYANLGLLTEFHWTAAHKAFKARSLIYAARLTAGERPAAWALWHRAYAEALAGLHSAALEDLAAAKERAEQSSGDRVERPKWVAVIDNFCRFDTAKLAAAIDDDDVGQLAALLRYLHVESDSTAAQTVNMARESLNVAPDCFRICDSVCEICAIATLHWATEFGLDRLFGSFPDYVRAMPGKPKSVATLLKKRGDDAAHAIDVAEALIEAGKNDADRDELSWAVLGGLTRETAFAQLWRRLHFMRFQWSVPIDGLLPAVVDLLKNHRYVAFLECYGLDGEELVDAANRFADVLDVSEISHRQRRAINAAMMRTWMQVRLNQHLATSSAAIAHDDDTYADLASRVGGVVHGWQAGVARRLWQVSPHGAAGPAALVKYDAKTAAKHLDEWEKEHAAHATVLAALVDHYLKSKEQANAERCLHAYVAISPDGWAYRALAEQYKQANNIDEWLKALDGFLEQEEFGLEHAQTRVEIANFFMGRKEFEKAKPYAEAAAESWAEWAMLCAVRCYVGLLDEEQEGIWRERLLERYPSQSYAENYFYWCRRTGQGDADAALEILDSYLAAQPGDNSVSGRAFIHLTAGRRREALKAFQAEAKQEGIEPKSAQFNLCYATMLALELSETEAANAALETIALTPSNFAKVMRLYETCRAAGEGARFDVAEARRILHGRPPAGVNNLALFVGWLLELVDQKTDAVEFYRIAATVRDTYLTANHCLARQALRRLGAPLDAAALKAGFEKAAEKANAEKATAEKAAGRQGAEQKESKRTP